jgi:hypothetical protein
MLFGIHLCKVVTRMYVCMHVGVFECKRIVGLKGASVLPDFSCHGIPKRGENIPNEHKLTD